MTPAPAGKLARGDMQQYKHAFRPFAFVNALNSDYSLLEQSHSFSHAWTHKIWSDLWVSYHIKLGWCAHVCGSMKTSAVVHIQ